MEQLPAVFQAISEKLEKSAHVKAVFGDPVEAHGKTVIPVAKISYGFGGGSGSNIAKNDSSKSENNSGGGGGGGIRTQAVGVVEISSEGTRFVALQPNWKSLLGGALIGLFLGLRLARKKK